MDGGFRARAGLLNAMVGKEIYEIRNRSKIDLDERAKKNPD